MRTMIAIVAAGVVCAPALAGIPTGAVIDDFGAGGPGLGFARSSSGAAFVSGGTGTLGNGGGFSYISSFENGYDASAFTGVSLKVSGLGGGTLALSVIGSGMGFAADSIPVNGYVNNGYLWITFDQLDAAAGNEIGFIASSMASGTGIWGMGLSYSGTGSITIDDFEFRSSPIPAPGAFALLGLAGLAGARRRR